MSRPSTVAKVRRYLARKTRSWRNPGQVGARPTGSSDVQPRYAVPYETQEQRDADALARMRLSQEAAERQERQAVEALKAAELERDALLSAARGQSALNDLVEAEWDIAGGDPRRAARRLSACLDDLSTPTLRLRGYQALIKALLSDGQVAAALTRLTQAAQNVDLRSTQWRPLADLMVTVGEPKRATALLRSVIEESRDTPEAGDQANPKGEGSADTSAVAAHLLMLIRVHEGGAAMLTALEGEFSHLLEDVAFREAALLQAALTQDVRIVDAVATLIGPIPPSSRAMHAIAAAYAANGAYEEALASIRTATPRPETAASLYGEGPSDAAWLDQPSQLDRLFQEINLALGDAHAARARVEQAASRGGADRPDHLLLGLLAFHAADAVSAAGHMALTFADRGPAMAGRLAGSPPEIQAWFQTALQRGRHDAYWRWVLDESLSSADQYETMLMRFACLFAAWDRPAVAYGLAGLVVDWNGGWVAEAAALRSSLTKRMAKEPAMASPSSAVTATRPTGRAAGSRKGVAH